MSLKIYILPKLSASRALKSSSVRVARMGKARLISDSKIQWL